MPKPEWQRKRERREEKLERMREQVASGELIVRQMSPAERTKWAERQREFEAKSSSAERDRRARAVKLRVKRAELALARAELAG